jgi:catechol 2,3-dioxygenase-like lactoylglutathione lyase family enzyme
MGEQRESSNPAPKVQTNFTHMYLSHINVTMPKGGEAMARLFYSSQLGLRELPRPKFLRACDGVWFEAGGLAVHISVEEQRQGPDAQRHFGLGCGDVDGLKARLKAAGAAIEDGPPEPWKRFFVHDPFGNRIEIHAPGALPA